MKFCGCDDAGGPNLCILLWVLIGLIDHAVEKCQWCCLQLMSPSASAHVPDGVVSAPFFTAQVCFPVPLHCMAWDNDNVWCCSWPQCYAPGTPINLWTQTHPPLTPGIQCFFSIFISDFVTSVSLAGSCVKLRWYWYKQALMVEVQQSSRKYED